ncbi:hypothetical protein VF14_03220 [Nostoc linckia z18]|jgi:hypothetical protein|uniref:SWIM-type domain-containing protein n=2 Tax=Nostoc linckia TaxID=92942 RepID=A0A9Q6ENR7_NOSLI|nr:hypothetical protein [Nostoc linckia]PHK42391.1 hypothetical protein VF12_03235 [Nostoc linckia z15]PHK46899.1 hypothetical protein VF13_07860 [Nostoc linckia z16]PHJ69161.1 hypothetical protein VF02_00690 [Nostoc linckia z1]PHJ73312.1 hypothetical protein VF05_01705 [Nostoc linckia z3]PHJ78659.1 hypothetical protein VF03_00690 [Nostoc linckia z2]
MQPKLAFTALAQWRDGKIYLTQDETDDIKGRRFRAKEVVEKYEFEIVENGVNFFPGSSRQLFVRLGAKACGCNCADIHNRHLPCKHIFGAAFLLGDKSALLDVPPPKIITPTNTNNATRKRRLRPQDIKVGKYFTLLDFLVSDTALKRGIPNFIDWESEPGQKALSLMQTLCDQMLDPLCEEFNRISITRGYLGLDLYKYVYNAGGADWPKGALAHGFSTSAGADIWVHSWSKPALDLAFYLQGNTTYTFDFIRVYPESPILCVGIDAIRQKRIIQQWHPNFRGCTIHKPQSTSRMGIVGELPLFDR